MFMVTEDEARTIRAAVAESGPAALATLRRIFPFLAPDDEAEALRWARLIAGLAEVRHPPSGSPEG